MATTSRRPSISMNGDHLAHRRMMGSGITQATSARRRQSAEPDAPVMNYQDKYQDVPPQAPAAPDVPRGPPVSSRNGARSFSARTRDLPPEQPIGPLGDDYDDAYAMALNEKKIYQRRAAEPRRSITHPIPSNGLGTGAVPSSSSIQTQRTRRASEAVSPPDSGSQASPISRSSTVRSTKNEGKSMDLDRGPLQRLEMTLKEQKRARMVEAEMRLKEEIARRQHQRMTREEVPTLSTRAAAGRGSTAANSSVQDSGVQKDAPSHSATLGSRRSGPAPVSADAGNDSRDNHYMKRQQPAAPRMPASGDVQYAAVQAAREPQYASADDDRQAAGIQMNSGRSQSGYHQRPHSMGNYPAEAPFRAESSSQRSAMNEPFANDLTAPAGVTRSNSKELQKRLDPEYEQRRSFGYDGRQMPPRKQVNQIGQQLPSHGPAVAALNKSLDHREGVQPGRNENDKALSQPKPKRQTVSFDVPPPTPPPLSEWREAPVARLNLADTEFERFDAEKGKTWWERGGRSNRRQSRALSNDYRKPSPKKNNKDRFEPPLFLKCGPLLRYLGIRRTNIDGPSGSVEQEVWRGSIMIVTTDSQSSYETPPTLCLFSQPMDLLPPPPREINGEEGVQLAPEYVDPTAGLIKVGRDGRTLYAKPVDHVDEEVDLSRVEGEDGLFEQSPSPIDYSSNGRGQPIPSNRIHPIDGEKSGRYERIAGFRLYSDPARNVTFWRFNIEIELGDKQERIAYRINEGPAIGFWVPGRGQSMNIMFHSCNGFSLSVDSNKFSGPDPLWRDVLNEHQTRPFHVMIGGGDQIYNDKVIQESKLFEEWTRIKNPHLKHHAPFSAAMKAELETFFLERYAMWFSQGLFSLANCQIPMINMWDDHDIIDGFGSYPDHFMRTPVFSGLGNVAYKYYLLFQHQSVPEESEANEPSWLLGPGPGPYIRAQSRSVFMSLGKSVAFLGLDCRTERMREEVLSEQTYDLIWDRCHREIVKGETKHLIVLLGIPVAYPRLVWLENLLTSRVMDPVKALSRAGMFSGLLNKFDGSVEILDDLDDHWTAKNHKTERTWLIEDLQDLAAEKSIRVTILSGDVHLAAMGQFYSNPKLNVAKDKDYRYMPNIVSSAIVNAPPSEMLSDVLNKRNKIHHMDSNTDEDMIPIFTHDVDGKPRNNKRLLPRRNWCSIREYSPGTTPPPTPPESPSGPMPELAPGKLRRTLSLTRGDSRDSPRGGLLRRLSLRGPPPTKGFNLEEARQRGVSMDAIRPPPSKTNNSRFPTAEVLRPGPFHRRPTNLSQKAAKTVKIEGDDGVGAYVNLEGGLDVTLNLEVNPKDPSGITAPYKLLVPALWYDGGYDLQPTRVVKGWKKWLGRGKQKASHDEDGNGEHEDDFSESDEERPSSHPAPLTSLPPQAHRPPHDDLSEEEEEELEVPRPRKKWLGLV